MDHAEVDLLPEPLPERLERALGVVAPAVEAPVDEPLHPRRSGRKSAATTSVEAAIARFEPPANDEKSAWPASTSPA